MQLALRLLLVLVISLCASAQGWVTQVVVFGDSLSDTENFYLKVNPPTWPYPLTKACNGPLAVEKMAAIYGVPLDNHAWFGATTGLGNYNDGGGQTSLGAFNIPGMTTTYQSSSLIVDPKAVYVVWAGPNDFVVAIEKNLPLDTTAVNAIANIVAIVQDLQSRGAKHILVPGMPDLGLTPYVAAMGLAETGSYLSDGFNALLRTSLPRKVNFFDTAGWMRQIIGNPAAYGFTNVTSPCAGSPASPQCSTYFFLDIFHPTAKVHDILGALFASCAQTRSGGNSAHCRAGLGPDPK